METSNKKVYARLVKPKPVRSPVPSKNEIKLDSSKPAQHYITMAEKVAKSTLYCMNWYVPQMKETHHRWSDRWCRIDKYFPYAEKGPLLVDEPSDENDADICYAKQKMMHEWGYRYAVIEAGTDFLGVLTQLGEN